MGMLQKKLKTIFKLTFGRGTLLKGHENPHGKESIIILCFIDSLSARDTQSSSL